MIAQEHLWIATEKGLVRYNLSRRSIDTPNLPLPLLQTAIQHLSLDSDGNLWGTSDYQIWSYSLSEKIIEIMVLNGW